MGKEYALRLEHVPEKWKPVFRKGHATTYRAALHRPNGAAGIYRDPNQ
jgi:hypothetical protein